MHLGFGFATASFPEIPERGHHPAKRACAVILVMGKVASKLFTGRILR